VPRSGHASGGKGSPVISPAVSGAVARSREGKERGGPDGRGRAVSGGSGRWQVGKGRRGLGAGRRAVRGKRVGELGRECLLGRARGRTGLIAGQAGMEPGRVRGGTGPAGLGWKKESEPWATSGFVGLTGLSWFWVCFLFLSQAQLPYEIKQLKPCISMNASTKLNLRKF